MTVPRKVRIDQVRIDQVRVRFATTLGRIIRMALVLVSLVSGLPHRAAGESPEPRATVIAWSTLPPAPPELARLIRDQRVKLITGPSPPSRRDPAERSGDAPNRPLAASTHYEIDYRFRSRPRWQHDRGTGQVRIDVTITQLRWQPRHTIWFRDPPAPESFWDDSLVRHEFDHVQLSGDRRLEKQFRDLLASQRIVKRTVPIGQSVDRAQIDRWIDEHVEGIFEQIGELIAVRYRELDRVTRHGRQQIPDDSVVETWLDRQSP